MRTERNWSAARPLVRTKEVMWETSKKWRYVQRPGCKQLTAYCAARGPGQRPPRKGRPAALSKVPFPARSARGGGRREATQGEGHAFFAAEVRRIASLISAIER